MPDLACAARRVGPYWGHSAEHVGTALQLQAGPAAPWEPLEFFFKKLAYDRELLHGLCLRFRPLPVHAGGIGVHPVHRLQTTDLYPNQGREAMDTSLVLPHQLGRIHW